jgi:uncharacterized Zn-binding protein involved in type VI secretion
MPGFVLHQGATVLCSHGGQAQPTAPNPRVRIMGMPVVTQPAPYVVAGCAMPPPPAGNGPCITAQWVTASLRVRVMGMPVLLLDSQAICAPTATPVIIAATQVRVKGM